MSLNPDRLIVNDDGAGAIYTAHSGKERKWAEQGALLENDPKGKLCFDASRGTETDNPIAPYVKNEIRPMNIFLLPLIAY